MRDQAEKQRLYKEIWQRVKGVYCKGFCVSERGLQAALYTELQKELSSDSLVIDQVHVPCHAVHEAEDDASQFPDMRTLHWSRRTR